MPGADNPAESVVDNPAESAARVQAESAAGVAHARGIAESKSRDRLLRRRLLLLRWVAETREEAHRLAEDLDPAHPVTRRLHSVAHTCSELEELLEQPSQM